MPRKIAAFVLPYGAVAYVSSYRAIVYVGATLSQIGQQNRPSFRPNSTL
jgi:hypothetical protein